MRRLLAVLGALVLTAGCADKVTGPGPARAIGGTVLDATSSGCDPNTICLDPVIVIGDPGSGDGSGSGGGGGGGEDGGDDPGDGQCMTSYGGEATVQGCSGGGTPPPAEEEEYSDICPQPIMGKVATALVNIAGRNHEFKFEGTFYRVNPLVGRSPAWYRIDRPTLSKDSWWMAESGSIQLVCWGRYVTVLGSRVWGGNGVCAGHRLACGNGTGTSGLLTQGASGGYVGVSRSGIAALHRRRAVRRPRSGEWRRAEGP